MLNIIINRFHEDKPNNTIISIVSIYDEDKLLFTSTGIENKEKAIPAESYIGSYTYSPKFKRNLWLIEDVPNRKGIRFHSANFSRELTGCVALGSNYSNGGVWNSKYVMREFHNALKTSQYGKVQIKIINLNNSILC